MPIRPVVLCGGEGKRLWPLSRPDRPKPLLPLGPGVSLLADTLARFAPPAYGPPLLVCGQVHAAAIAALHPGVELLVEPTPTGTAAAVLGAAADVPPDTLVLAVPADHVIGDAGPLHEAVAAAAPLAEDGELVLFGLVATRAEVGYGWVTLGPALGRGAFRVARFEEKPAAPRARELLGAGALWNAGMFLFRAGALLEVARTLGVLPGPVVGSFDHRIAERAPRVAAVPVALDWSDLGTWSAVRERHPGGLHAGPVDTRDAPGSWVVTDGPPVTIRGVPDVIVVVAGGAVLVTRGGE